MRAECDQLAARLHASRSWPELRAVYLDVMPLVGQLQGAVSEAVRGREGTDALNEAQATLEQLKASSRQVGLDIRLSSDTALLMGLQAILESAYATLDALERIS